MVPRRRERHGGGRGDNRWRRHSLRGHDLAEAAEAARSCLSGLTFASSSSRRANGARDFDPENVAKRARELLGLWKRERTIRRGFAPVATCAIMMAWSGNRFS